MPSGNLPIDFDVLAQTMLNNSAISAKVHLQKLQNSHSPIPTLPTANNDTN